uniref:McrBC restriction endonuclease system protein McrB n=1 Tax=uncultured marine thaumarchaeote AD1000_02_C08 TaxID=1455880 RepID=A0A075FH05_9ARCH|nr:McrBC restriction endonuclease system protein McrB [uncultured marine thaumarchaeote AD1000_02_C08]
MYLLEYREDIITLPYSGRGFHIPDGVYIIGTMNTADRSIAMVDYALRRRFAFFGLEPNEELFNKPGTEFWIKDGDVRKDAVMVMKELNDKIEKINGLGEGYRIGHSYFMRKGGIDREQFRRILEYRVGALIREYGQVIDDGAKESLNGVIEKFTQK